MKLINSDLKTFLTFAVAHPNGGSMDFDLKRLPTLLLLVTDCIQMFDLILCLTYWFYYKNGCLMECYDDGPSGVLLIGHERSILDTTYVYI